MTEPAAIRVFPVGSADGEQPTVTLLVEDDIVRVGDSFGGLVEVDGANLRELADALLCAHVYRGRVKSGRKK